MAAHLVTYDLRNPSRNYTPLYERLQDWRAVRLLQSVWLIRADAQTEQIRNDLMSFMDGDDGIAVTLLAGQMAWSRVDASDQQIRSIFAV